MTEALLMHADTERSADMFHAIPLDIIDPFLYVEAGERKVAVIGVLERDRILGRGLGIELLDPFSLGLDELLDGGVGFLEAEIEVDLRACRELGVEHAVVPPDFPLAWAEHLRAGGVQVSMDAIRFDLRRRVKTEAELAGIRRAQVAARCTRSPASPSRQRGSRPCAPRSPRRRWTGGTTTASATASARGPRAPEPRALRRAAARRRRRDHRAGALPAGLRRSAPGGPGADHRGLLRGPYGLSVRARALMHH